MKFGKQLLHDMVPEWQEEYIQYNVLKKMLKEMYSNVLDVAATSSDHISIDLTHDQIKQMRNKHISHNHDQSHAKPQNPEELMASMNMSNDNNNNNSNDGSDSDTTTHSTTSKSSSLSKSSHHDHSNHDDHNKGEPYSNKPPLPKKPTLVVSNIKHENQFWDFLEAEVHKVDKFYKTQLNNNFTYFHNMVTLLVQLGIIQEYIPMSKESKSRLERELKRRHVDVTIHTSGDRDKPQIPLEAISASNFSLVIQIDNSKGKEDNNKDDSDTKQHNDHQNNKNLLNPDNIPQHHQQHRQQQQQDQQQHPTGLHHRSASDVDISYAHSHHKHTTSHHGDSFHDNTHHPENQTTNHFNNKIQDILRNYNKINSLVMTAMKDAITHIGDPLHHSEPHGKGPHVDEAHAREATKQIQEAFCDYYLGLVFVQRFCELNLQAIRKIVKKHDKLFGSDKQERYVRRMKTEFAFPYHRELKILISETEIVFANAFTGGHRTEALKQLRVPSPKEENVEQSNFRLGLNVGIALPLLFLMIYLNSSVDPYKVYPRFASVLVVYRMLGVAIVLLWGWGIDMLVWTKYHINYIHILNFDQRHHWRYEHMFEAASIFSILWVFSFFLYLIHSVQPRGFTWVNDIPWQFFPLSLVIIGVAVVLWFQFKSRYWFFTTLFNIVTGGFRSRVLFKDSFVADQIMSVVIVLTDMEFTACFFVSDAWTGDNACTRGNVWAKPFIAILPTTWRFLQCINAYRQTKNQRFLYNAGKYFCSYFVIVFSALNGAKVPGFKWLWLCAIIINTIYTFTWDIRFDWNLSIAYPPRSQMRYPIHAYYIAIGANLVMRLAWTLTISPESIGIVMDPILFGILLACLEAARRVMWNCFRLENEHLNNVSAMKALELPGIDTIVDNNNWVSMKVQASPMPVRSKH